MNFKSSGALGFTMVELILVIAVIGVLASIAFMSYSEARQQARDDIRISQLEQLRIAIELYKSETGTYPPGCRGSGLWSSEPGRTGECTAGDPNYIVGLVPNYISKLPTDPITAVGDSGFSYISDGTSFKLMVHNSVESKFVTSYSHPYARCPRIIGICTGAVPPAGTYAVYSSGAEGY